MNQTLGQFPAKIGFAEKCQVASHLPRFCKIIISKGPPKINILSFSGGNPENPGAAPGYRPLDLNILPKKGSTAFT
jgi:hypothetical protein